MWKLPGGTGGGSAARRGILALWAALSILAASMLASGSPAPTAYASTSVVVGGKAVVANTGGDPIRVRQGAGVEYARIAYAYEGQTASVLDGPSSDTAGNTWFKVQVPGGTGWMSAEFLQGTGSPSAPALTGTGRVANTNGDPLRVRSAPNTGGTVLTRLDPGAPVLIRDGPVTDATGIVWYKISANGVTGWAMAQYLEQTYRVPADNANTTPQAEQAAASRPAATPTAVSARKPTATAVPTQNTTGPKTTMAQYRQWMEEARAMYPYPQSVDKMWRVMMCESGGNPGASGGGGLWLGLFQYAPGTWHGSWNPYRTSSIWDAKSQIFATAKAWSIGMQSAWSCYYITAGR